MESHTKPQSALFQVYLRLRPAPAPSTLYPTLTTPERFLTVEESAEGAPTHITLNPPNDNRRRAVEKFAFTEVFQEEASQLDIFHGTGVIPLVEGVLAAHGGEGRDGLLATLGVTGSGKSHTILGSRSQRGLTQLALDLLFRSISNNILDPSTNYSVHNSIADSDPSEAQVLSTQGFLDIIYGDTSNSSRANSRAATPMRGDSIPPPTRRQALPRPSVLPTTPDIAGITVDSDPAAEYAILISMYEVYNDRIYDLLTPASRAPSTKEIRRRPLLFKPTEASPERKVVAGLRKVICASMREALMVLEAGLNERRVTGTSSNSVSSRSHGFFCVEVKKRERGRGEWSGSALTVVDLAGSERARDAKTQGATLAEAGKINESLMYLGQCLQMQSDIGSSAKPNIVPYRQCKLTELLFSNSFPTSSSSHAPRPQKATMIVAADPVGDFNATSQILRYSALAREVTVPRVPSISATLLSSSTSGAAARAVFSASHGSASSHVSSSSSSGHGHGRSHSEERATIELAAQEIARLHEEAELLRDEVCAERAAREVAEAHAESAEERAVEVEQVVREEVWGEMEARLAREMRTWKARWEEERERGGEHLDRKVEVVVRGLAAAEGKENCAPEPGEGWEVLEEENRALRALVGRLQREVGGRSPSRVERGVLGEVGGKVGNAGGAGSPVKRVRKLGPRKWDFAEEELL